MASPTVASIEPRGDSKVPVGIGSGLTQGYGQQSIGYNKYEFTYNPELFRDMISRNKFQNAPRLEVVDRIFNPPQRNPALVPFDRYKTMKKEFADMLYPLQLQAIHDLVEIHDGNGYLEAPPGSGKTMPACAVYGHYGGSCCIVCPATVCPTWEETILDVLGVEATIITGSKWEWGKLPKIVIISFDSLRMNKTVMDKEKWNMVIIDEAHLIKNPAAKKTIACLKVMSRSKHVLLMSGTPMKKCPSDLYCQLLPILGSDVLGTFDQYCIRYCSAKYEIVSGFGPIWMRKGKGKRKLVMHQASFKAELNLLLDSCTVRIPVNMEEMLPPFKRFIEPLQLSLEDIMAQNEIRDKMEKCGSKEEHDMLVMEIWRLTCTQKAPHHSRVINEDLIKNTDKGRMIVYTHFRSTADYIIERLPEGTRTIRIDGRTSKKRRRIGIRALARKGNPHNIDIGFLSIGTCALGICLQPQRTNCYFADLPFSVQDILQCENKLRRLGAELPITSIWGMAEGSYDDNLLVSLKRKLNVASEVVKGKRQALDFNEMAFLKDYSDSEDEEQEESAAAAAPEPKRQKTLDDFWVL